MPAKEIGSAQCRSNGLSLSVLLGSAHSEATSNGRPTVSIADFKSPTGRNMFVSMLKLKKQQENNRQQIETLRSSIPQTSSQKELRTIKAAISQLEKTIETNETEIKNIEKKIRNAENLL